MEIKSKLFGNQAVDPNTIITFPQGIPGFEDNTRFKLFHQEDSDFVYWLQSLDDDELVFSVALSTRFNINYQFMLSDTEEAILEIGDQDDIIILIILHKDENQSLPEHPTVKGSINSPLLINVSTRKGLQKVLQNVEQSIVLSETSQEIDLTEH